MSNPSGDHFSFLQKTLLFVERRSALVLFIFALIFLFCLWGLQFSRLQLDIYDVYDPNFQSSVDLTEMKSAYSDRSQMLVAFEFKKKPTAGELCRLLIWSQNLARYREVKSVTSLWSIRSPKVTENKVLYPKSLENPCELEGTKIYEIKDHFSGSFFRHLISQSGSQNLVFDIAFSGSDSDTSQVQYIIDITNSFIKNEMSSASASYLGMAAFRYYFKKIMLKDSIYNLLILMIIIIFLRVVYGTWRCGLYLALTLVGSMIILYGSMALVGIPIDILTNNLFLMTAVAGTADFIFVSQFQMTGSYKESLYQLVAPCFFTTLTTVVGFLSLNTSDLEIITRFGNGAALGAMAEWVMMFLFFPALLKLTKQEKTWVNPEKAIDLKLLGKLENHSLPKGAIWFLNLAMLLSIPSFFFLNDQDSPVENLPKDHVLRVAYEDFQNKFQWQGQVYLYFPEQLPLGEHQTIMSSVSKLNLVRRAEDPQELATDWTQGLPPLRKDLILRELSMTPLWERYYSKQDNLRVPLYLKEQDLHSLRKLRDKLSSICDGKCRLAGQRVVYLEYGEKISRTMIESFGVSILLVVSILAWLLWIENKIKYIVPVILSALMGPLVTLTFIALFQIPVTLITSIFLAVMVGLAGDNAIQYLMAPGKNLEERIASRGRASIIVALVMIFGSAMFTLQSLLPMKILGYLFITGFFINVTGDLWGLKGLLTKKLE